MSTGLKEPEIDLTKTGWNRVVSTSLELLRWLVALALPHSGTVIALSSIGLFLVSISLNGFVFNWWGLNFLQVATPADVLMSGVLLGIFFICVSLVVIWLISLFMSMELPFGLACSIAGIIAGTINALFLATIFLRVDVLGIVIIRPIPPPLSPESSIFEIALTFLPAIGAALSLVMPLLSTYRELFRRGGFPKWPAGVTYTIFAVVICAAIWTYTSYCAEVGMFGPGVITDPAPGCGKAKILWAGERHAVVRCADKREVLVLSDKLEAVDLGPQYGVLWRTNGLQPSAAPSAQGKKAP